MAASCRELAFQIAEQMKAFGQNARTSVEVIVGGIGASLDSKIYFFSSTFI